MFHSCSFQKEGCAIEFIEFEFEICESNQRKFNHALNSPNLQLILLSASTQKI